MKCKETIVRREITYQPAEELSEAVNESFKSVFREEEAFTEPIMTET